MAILLGGPHASVNPKDTAEYFKEFSAYVFIGESEKTLPVFLGRLADKNTSFFDIPGLAYFDKDNLILNKPAAFVEDLDSLGMPAWDLIKPNEYPPAQHGAFFVNYPIAPIMTTRGCPYMCSFCSAPVLSGHKVRKRSPESIVNEITLLYRDFHIREIHIIDDNFSCDVKHAKDTLKKILETGLKISIAFPNGLRIETIDEELLDLMKKCGVYLISLGIESGSDRVLKLINKSLSIGKIKSQIAMIAKSGIDIAGFFVMGFPGETKEEIEKTIRFSLELPLIRANYFTFLPLPGTTMYREMQESGEINHVDWHNFYFMRAPYAPKGMTSAELRSLQKSAFIRFFLRPSIFIKNVSKIRSPRHFWYLFKRFYKWIVS